MSHTIDQMFIGQIARSKRVFTGEDVRLYSELTLDFSLVYQENHVGSIYTKPIIPGILTEGLVHHTISSKLPGSPCILLQKELVFYRPLHIGDEVIAELEVIDINEARNWVTLKVTCYNQSGTEVVKGQAVIFLLPDQGS
jgi:3-hydroxybutyryl-CoA dehydratase